jgi:hypothetical protein
MTDEERESQTHDGGDMEPKLHERRNFLVSLGKWSKAVIGGVVLGGLLAPGRDANAVGWANRNDGDRTWVNFGGGWGWRPGWNNRGWNNGGWYNRWNNGGWHNRPWNNRSWHNRPWNNGGWNNGGSWFNGPGWGGSWVNR